jgi:hypothetical protein
MHDPSPPTVASGDDGPGGPDGWERYLAELVHDRLVIVAFEVLASMTRKVADLRRWGSRRPMLVALGEGTGVLPTEADADIVLLPALRATSVTEEVRVRARGTVLPTDVVARIESRDPRREALWWVSPIGLDDPILGRRVIGGRSRAQATLEDKMTADALWDAAGVARAPTRVAEADLTELHRASDEIRQDTGSDTVVWSGDARDGINGGGDFVRWITDDAVARASAGFFARACDTVRVMPFLEGVPCSIHGMVLDDGVAVFRPVELVSLRRPATGRFVYGGLGTTWDPSASGREEMRTAARSVGETLRRDHGYRGGYGIDGVMTTTGFRPTELNPRFSGGLARLSRVAAELHLELLQLNLTAGRPARMPAAEYERSALELLDSHRFFDAMGVSTHGHTDVTEIVPVVYADERLRRCEAGEQPVGDIACGPSALGRFVRLTAAPGTLPQVRCADLSRQVLSLADQWWDTRFGPLEVPPDVDAGSRITRRP